MNWQQVTQSFLPLSREQTSSFAPPREIDLAIAAYNRAIRNLNQDSADIALIALRKLAVDYPDFLEASLLYGCCLAQVGQLADAREQLVKTASYPELPGDLEEAAQAALQAVDQDLAIQAAQIAAGKPANGRTANGKSIPEFGTADRPGRPADALLEKTGRRGRVRMASERERREFMRRSDMPRDEETHVVMSRNPVDFFRLAIPITGALILIVVIIFLATKVLPMLHLGSNKPSADERLDYLLKQIEKKAAGDEEWKQLLADYQAHFDPTPTPAPTTALATTADATTTGTSQAFQMTAGTTAPTMTETMATTAVTTAVTTMLTTAPMAIPADQVLLSAFTLYQQAIAAQAADPITASEKLYQAIAQLKAIPAATTAAGVSKNAGSLLNDSLAQYEQVYRTGAEKLRLLAVPLFDQNKYQESLNYYLRSYTLYPGGYGGGVAYYCGRCYQLLNQPAKARPYYEYVIAYFAGKSIATSAASRLKELG